MGQQRQIEDMDYKTRLIEFANQLALKRPDLNLLRDHPREQYPVLTESLECLLKERDAQRKLVLPNLAAFNNDAVGIFRARRHSQDATQFNDWARTSCDRRRFLSFAGTGGRQYASVWGSL